MYGMKGTIPAIVKRIEGSEDTREALGTISWSFFAKKASQRRWISEVRMREVSFLVLGGQRAAEECERDDGEMGSAIAKAPVRVPEYTRRGLSRRERKRSARVVLDDHLDVDGHGDLSALGARDELGLQLGQLDREVRGGGGQHIGVATLGSDLEGLHRLRLGLDLDGLARRHAERGTVHQLAVDQDVAVHDGLTGLQGGAGEAGAEHERVQAHLQQLDHALTGQARLLLRVQVGAVHLLLAQAVLGAQALLLLEPHGVVGLGAAAGTAVLARGVRALLEVLDGLRGEREPEGSGQTRLTARTGDVGHEVYLLFACGESSLAAADSATHTTAGAPPGPRPTA